MNRILLLTLLFATIYSTANVLAQQSYQSKHYGGPGTIYLYNRIAGVLPVADLTETGPALTWDLGEFTDLNTHANQIVTPSSAFDQFTFLAICGFSGISPLECFSIWNNTDQALLLNDSLSLLGLSLKDLKRFQEKSNTRLLENFFGFTVDFEGTPTSAVIVYESPDTILLFPVEYEDNWNSRIKWGLDLAATGMNIQYSSTQSRITTVDAWGTVMTPYDTFTNVIRVRSEIHHQDTLFSDSITIPVDFRQVEYMWLDTMYKLPVLIATGIINDSIEIINVVEYIYEATCLTPTWSVDASENIYYLDDSGSVTVDFIVTNDNADEFTWDFADGEIATTEGSTTHTYTLPGNYAVAVSGCMTDCLPLNTCNFAIVDFEIVDSTTSVTTIPGAELGILLYPNPVNNELMLDIPAALGELQFQIIDITGRHCLNGFLPGGKSSINTMRLEDGLYTIKMYPAHQKPVTAATMRFVVTHRS